MSAAEVHRSNKITPRALFRGHDPNNIDIEHATAAKKLALDKNTLVR